MKRYDLFQVGRPSPTLLCCVKPLLVSISTSQGQAPAKDICFAASVTADEEVWLFLIDVPLWSLRSWRDG